MKLRALITGASSGIGLALAKEFAKQGYNLLITARNTQALENLKHEIEEKYKVLVTCYTQNLEEKNAGQILFNQIKSDGYTIDILINNAGFGDFGEFASCSWEKQEKMVQVNILSLMELTRLILPEMLARNQGKIMNVASVAGFQCGPFMSIYYASKAFVLSFSEAIAEEVAQTKVSITALCPGPVKTGFEQAANLGHSKLFESFRVSSAEEVATFGFQSLMKNKVIAIPMWNNRLLVFLERFSPRFLVRKIVKYSQRKI